MQQKQQNNKTTKGQNNMILEFSDDDLLGSKLVVPGWYEVIINDVVVKPSNDGTSENAWFKGKIIKNADTGSREFEGTPTPYLWLVSAKAPFSLVPMLRAIGVEPKKGDKVDPVALKGKRLEMYIGNQPNPKTGKMQNSETGQFRQLRESVGGSQ